MTTDNDQRPDPERPAKEPIPTSPPRDAELDAERLAEAVGEAILADPDSAVWRDDRFVEWVAAQARAEGERDRRRDRRSDEAAFERGRQMLLRVQARRLGLPRLAQRPVERSPTAPGTPAGVIGGAAAEGRAPLVDLAVAAGVGRDLWDEPVERWIDLPDDVPRGRHLALRIAGDSMAPLMHTGDTVLVRLDHPIQVGDVIVARHPDDGYLCKVVRRLRPTMIELGSLDPSARVIAIPREDALIVGVVVLVWCHHGEPPPDDAR